MALPDFDGWKPADKAKKIVSVFEERESQETSTTADSESHASFAKDDETPMSSLDESMPPPSSAASLSRTSSTPARTDIRKFSYSQSTETPASTTSQRSSVFSVASTPSTAPSTAASRMTPLQRLGARAMNAPMSPKLPKPRSSIDRQFLSGVPINPAFVPLPKVNLDEVAQLNQCGSEDQIIPASDEEDEGEDEDEIDLPPKKLNLSRFAFA
jgi:exonuclease-1